MGNGELELINCGHVPPLLVSGDTVTQAWKKATCRWAWCRRRNLPSRGLKLIAGDRLLLVTDGVTEAEDADGEFFGSERLEACCGQGFAAIEQAMTTFRGDTPLTDDCTITEMIYRG